jgi:hypothetical protein
MPPLVRGLPDDAVLVHGGVALGELEVPASHRVAEVAAPVALREASTTPQLRVP